MTDQDNELRNQIAMLNQVFEIERKLKGKSLPVTIDRQIDALKEGFRQLGLTCENPLGEAFDETRSDCEGTVAGMESENLKIVEVIKPIVRQEKDGCIRVVQKAVVVAAAASKRRHHE